MMSRITEIYEIGLFIAFIFCIYSLLWPYITKIVNQAVLDIKKESSDVEQNLYGIQKEYEHKLCAVDDHKLNITHKHNQNTMRLSTGLSRKLKYETELYIIDAAKTEKALQIKMMIEIIKQSIYSEESNTYRSTVSCIRSCTKLLDKIYSK